MNTQSHPLSGLQLAILRVIWTRGEATAQEIEDDLKRNRRTAYSTIATLLGRLARRGVVKHHLRGRQYVYRSQIDEEEVRRSMVDQLVENLFQGHSSDLLQHLLREQAARTEDSAKAVPPPSALPGDAPRSWAPPGPSLRDSSVADGLPAT